MARENHSDWGAVSVILTADTIIYRLAQACRRESTTRADVVRAAIAEYLDRAEEKEVTA
ncbi:hypothetical protein [Rhizobium sp. PL01]|uniref:hypothetical protein n=1 Tax=Rhizobium sp. PL01 TaxID=3085631 RepID=UPI0029825355|nr:hypothetical protein [Rhizobium sp. PL01]MDW5313667.1 hypothetical protein [Rhizobium sp. PL01]